VKQDKTSSPHRPCWGRALLCVCVCVCVVVVLVVVAIVIVIVKLILSQ
jgi:hypothetical protein